MAALADWSSTGSKYAHVGVKDDTRRDAEHVSQAMLPQNPHGRAAPVMLLTVQRVPRPGHHFGGAARRFTTHPRHPPLRGHTISQILSPGDLVASLSLITPQLAALRSSRRRGQDFLH